MNLEVLPGGDLIETGLADLSRGVVSIEALLVSVGSPRLRRIGFDIPRTISEPEDKLYERLAEFDPDSAHSRYNALIRRLVSFERAAERACSVDGESALQESTVRGEGVFHHGIVLCGRLLPSGRVERPPR